MAKPQFDAARRLLGVIEHLLTTGDTVVTRVTGGRTAIQEWEQFPEHEQEDVRTGFRYYYHSHPCPGSWIEHGHFHLFKRIGLGDEPSSFSHILAIGVDRSALPVRFFATNVWVTGETLQTGASVKRFAADFRFGGAEFSDPVAEWIHQVLAVFSAEVSELIDVRDSRCEELSKRRPAFSNDRRTIQLAQVELDLPAKLLEIETRYNERGVN